MPVKKVPSTKVVKTVKKKENVEDAEEIVTEECQSDLNVELLKHIDQLTKRLESSTKAQTDFVTSMEDLKSFSEESFTPLHI